MAYIKLPSAADVPRKIHRNPKFWLFFQHAVGAIDGSHIPVAPPAILRGQYRNRKGFLSQNTLFVCDFNMKFMYMLTGLEGSATDLWVYDDVISSDLQIPDGKYLLADGGYPLCHKLLVPYRGIQYHLSEWGQANIW